ncbi:hypothetical protein T4E_11594 [Trichinella pseudospiralis]|uniref:Uncharacterized protein n=1 Tax=Trichinella pseudospiralis TaxID=6337 RepID=A0A0V0XJQ9_TRIPS|nr:hypothetical protein T4E_11594 [Trichinella pseudospiralis]
MLRHRILLACAYLQQVLGERLMGVDSSSNSLGIVRAGVGKLLLKQAFTREAT